MAVEKNEEVEFDMDVFDMGDISLESIKEDIPADIEIPTKEVEDNKQDNNISDPPVKEEESVASEDKDLEDKGDKTDDSKGSSQKLYSSLASALAEEGIISSLDSNTKIESPEDLFEVIRTEIKKNELSDLTEDQREYLQALRTGIPKEEFHAYKKVEQDLASIEETELESNVELRKAIIIADFENQGIPKERAIKLAQRSIDIGEDLDDAKESLNSIKIKHKEKFQERLQKEAEAKELAKQNEVKEIENLKKTVFDTTEIIPGIKINEKVKKEVYDQMIKPVHVDEKGIQYNALTKARLDDPVNFTVKLHYLFKITNGFKDFEKLKTNAKSKAALELENTLKGHTFIPQGDKAAEMTDFDLDTEGFKGEIIL